jgi:hypothetical protein
LSKWAIAGRTKKKSVDIRGFSNEIRSRGCMQIRLIAGDHHGCVHDTTAAAHALDDKM